MMDRAILLIGLIAIAFCGTVSGGIDKTIKQQKGRTVVLDCPIDAEACGDLHSLNWFKGDTRIAVMLGGVNVSSVVTEYSERVKLEESPYRLTLNDLRISDEDVYICDTTFYIPQESCDATRGYRTEVIVLVPPSEILVLDEKNEKIKNGSIIGPVEEGKTLTAICKVEKTRPQPSMAWYRGNKRLTTHSPSYDEDEDGLFTATLELSLVLSRMDLDNDIECRVESAALEEIYKTLIKLDLQVRPTGIQLDGVGHHTTQGTLTTLSCKVSGARPSANISWTNGTEIIDPNENGDNVEIRLYHQLQKEGTYDTESQLIFTASRFENDVTFGCHASNIVIKRNNEKPMHAEIPLEVLYPPVVEVLEEDITVNEHKRTTLTCDFIANPASLTGVKWYKNGAAIAMNKSKRFEGGIPDHVPITILNAHRDDRGNYTCELTNAIGSGNSTVQIQLDVLYVPSVEVIMLPRGPVMENDEVNVTLLCNITDANPWSLTKVRWFANSTLLKELPDCSNQSNNSEDLCNIDPSKLLLESVGRGFAYNYSCEGFNTAGWGNRSVEEELIVFHEPGPATLSYYPLTVVKKQSVTFSCSVDVLGVPEATQYRWFRGGQGPLIDVNKKDWTIELVDLDSRTNFSCLAFNDGGKGEQANINLDVKAPPFFIKNLVPYTGVLFSTKNASLTCRVECVPRCKINWFKDGVGIYANDTNKYHIKEEYLKENPATGDFESVLSILHFNMSAWPNQQFDMHYDNANYSCVASENEVGPGVRSATYFSIEYPPENTTVSNEIVNVTENTVPARVLCNSKANPEPSYEWTLEDKSLAQGNALIINKPMLRNESGHYKCVAFNKHGSSHASTFINIQYKPHCDIDRKMVDDQDTLICTAYGNPDEFGFVWSTKTENDSVEIGSSPIGGNKAFFVINDDFTITRTYRCVANNTIGEGHFCEIEVAGQLAWWQRWDRTTLIIVIAAVSAILLAVIIICCIIICICRRRRRQDKYNTAEASICATQSVLSYQASSPLPTSSSIQITSEVPKSPPKWPLRPGVMVHVKNDTKQNLCANRNIHHKRSLSFSNQTNKITATANTTTTVDSCTNEQNCNIIKSSLNKSAPASSCDITATITPINTKTTTIHQSQNVNKPNENCTNNSETQQLTAPLASSQPPSIPSDSIQIECNNNSVGIQTDDIDKFKISDMMLVTKNGIINDEDKIETNKQHPTALISSSSSLLANTITSNSTAKVHIASPFKANGTTITSTILQPPQPPPPPPPPLLLQSNNQLTETTITSTIIKAQKNEIKSNEKIDQKSLPRNIKSPSKSIQTTSQAIVRVNPNNTIPTDTPNREFMKAVIKPSTTRRTTAADKPKQSYKISSTTSMTTDIDEIKPLASSSPLKLTSLKSFDEHNELQISLRPLPPPSSSSKSSVISQNQISKDIPPKLPKRNIPPRPPPPTTQQISAITKNSINNSHLDAINSSINLTNELLPRHSNTNTTNLNLNRKVKSIGTSTMTVASTPTTALVSRCELASDEEYEDDTISITKSPIGEVISRRGNKNSQNCSGNNNIISGNSNSNNNNNGNTSSTLGGYNLPSPSRNIGGNLFEKIFGEIFSKRNFSKGSNNNHNDDLNSLNSERSENRLLRYFGMSKVFKRQRLQRNDSCSSSNPFTVEHRLKGLRSSGSVHGKSSTLADPLTEPGEYENLPFHGLQQAPNKFTTTPINFNNNTNVVRVAPRPKLTQTNQHQQNLNQFHQIFSQQQLQQQNLTSNNQNNYHQKSIQFPNQNQHQSQQQLHYQIQQQYSPADCYTNSLKLIQNKTKTKNLNYGSSTLKLEKRKPIIGVSGDNNFDITRTTDRFPTSYTEYFQQQKFSDIISDNQNNSIDRTTLNPNYPYTVVENGIITPTSTITQLTPSSSSVSSSRIIFNNSNSTNPFLATNFRKFHISTGTRPGCGTITANHRKKQHGNSSNNSIIGSSGEKKFYSLKALKNKNNLSFSSIKPSALLSNSNNSNSNNKCKRHHSFAGGSFADVINGIDINNSIDITVNNLPYTMQPKIKFYEPPTYENLTDSIQIHESPSENLIQQQSIDNIQTHLKTQQQLGNTIITKTKIPNKQNHTLTSSGSSSSKLNNSLNLSTSSTTTTSVVDGIGNQYIIQKPNQQKHQHHQIQRQKMNDDNTKKHLMEPERMSIYRSDSGISNSSYECVTPIAPPRQYNLLDDDIIDTTICINKNNDINNDENIDNHQYGDAIDKCNPDITKANRIDKLYNSAINSTTSTTSTSLSSYNNSINNRKLLENDFDRLNNESNSSYNNSLLNPELSHHYLNNPNKSQYTSNTTNQKNSTTAADANIVTNTNDLTTASNLSNTTTNKTNNIMHDGLSIKCQNKKNDQHEQRHHNQKKSTITTSTTSISNNDNSRTNNLIISSSNKIGSKRRTNTTSSLTNSSYNNTANVVGHEQRSINTNPFLVTSPSTTSSSSSSGCISNNSSNEKSSSSFFSTTSQSEELKSSTLSSSSASSSSTSTIRGGGTSCEGNPTSSSSTLSSSAPTSKYKKLKSSQQLQTKLTNNIPNETYTNNNTEKENSDAETSIITSKSLNAKYQPPKISTNTDVIYQQITKSSSSLSLPKDDVAQNEDTSSNYLKSNSILNSKHATQINNQFYEMIKNRYPGYITKPIKQIPLRKHHSFHFQQQQQFYPNPNTMLGQLKLHQIQKEQAKAAAAALETSTILRDSNNIKNVYKQVGGPLVYRPFLNENTAFKPISPVHITKSPLITKTANYFNDNESINYHQQYSDNNSSQLQEHLYNIETIENRYPIVSLKRHTSNIESHYDSKRYASIIHQNNRDDSPINFENSATNSSIQLNFKNRESSNFSSELEDNDDDDDEDDEILMQRDDDANSSASNSTIVGKRLVYVDFDILSTKSDNNYYKSKQYQNENSYPTLDELNKETIYIEEQINNMVDNYDNSQKQTNNDNNEENYDLKINPDSEKTTKLKSKYDQLFKQNHIQINKSPLNTPTKSITPLLQQYQIVENQQNDLKLKETEREIKNQQKSNEEDDNGENKDIICETSSISGIILAKPPTKRNTQYATLKYNEVKI